MIADSISKLVHKSSDATLHFFEIIISYVLYYFFPQTTWRGRCPGAATVLYKMAASVLLVNRRLSRRPLHHQAHEISVIQGYLAVTLCIIPIIGVVINGMLLIGILVENN